MIEEKKRTGFYLTLLTAVTVICIIVGCVIHLGFFSLGKAGKMKSEETATERFQSISLELDTGDVTIEKGSDFRVSYRYPSNGLPEISVSDGKLVVKQKMKNTINMKNMDCYLTITVPEGEELKNLDASLDVGNIEVSGFSFAASSKVDLETDVGNIDLYDCTFGDLKLETDVGNTHIGTSTFKKLSSSGDVGDIEIDQCTFESATCGTDTGSISVSGSFSDLSCKTDMGSITVETDKPIKDETLDLKASAGNITVNGQEFEGSYKK